MRADEKHAFFIDRSDTAGAVAVAMRRRLGQAGRKSAFALERSLRSFIVELCTVKNFSHHGTRESVLQFDEYFERLVVNNKTQIRIPKVVAKTMDSPDDGSRFHIE